MFSQIPMHSRRGLALLEVMIAVGLLTGAVAAITSAIVAGQQQSMEARIKIVGSIAAKSLLSQISLEPWETLDTWHGYTEDVGTLTDPTGAPLEGDWSAIGRSVSIIESQVLIDSLEVFVVGRTISVTAFDSSSRVLTTLERFIPEPQS